MRTVRYSPGNLGFPFFFLKRYSLLSFLLLTLTIGIEGCKKDEMTVINIVPDGEQPNTLVTDTFSFKTSTIESSQLRMDGLSVQLLGQRMDEDFGISSAAIVAQIVPKEKLINPEMFNGGTIDSIILHLVYLDNYGEPVPMDFSVYGLRSSLVSGQAYYNDHQTDINPAEIGQLYGHTPRPQDTLSISGITSPPQLRIPLDKELGYKLVMDGPTHFSTVSSFVNFFPGIFISAKISGTGSGTILTLNMLSPSSGITVYGKKTQYNNETVSSSSFSMGFIFSSEIVRFSTFNHETEGFPVAQAVGDGENHSGLIYVNGLGGHLGKIEVPHLFELTKQGPIAVHSAKWILPSYPLANESLEMVQQIFIDGEDENGTRIPLTKDLQEGANHYGGILDTLNNTYTVNSPRYIQDLLTNSYNGETVSPVFYIRAGFGSINANQTLINTEPGLNESFKLVVSYTPIK